MRKLCDVRKLCEYAKNKGWIKRIHKYPALSVKIEELMNDHKKDPENHGLYMHKTSFEHEQEVYHIFLRSVPHKNKIALFVGVLTNRRVIQELFLDFLAKFPLNWSMKKDEFCNRKKKKKNLHCVSSRHSIDEVCAHLDMNDKDLEETLNKLYDENVIYFYQ